MSADIQTISIEDSALGADGYVRAIAWRHRYLAAIVLAYGVAAIMVTSLFVTGIWASPLGESALVSAVCTGGLYGLAWYRPVWLARFIPPDGREPGLPSQRVLQGLFTMVPMPVFFASFSAFKISIPAISPFRWDSTFVAWDRLIHGGVDPWRLLQPILGRPGATATIDAVYALWFFVVFGAYFWQAFSVRHPQRRMHFLLGFVLTWIAVGTVAATLLSSAGPVYLERVTGDGATYADLLAYLHNVDVSHPLLAVQTHEMLWTAYRSGAAELGQGISAMPSMHLAASVVVLLLFWRSGVPARIAAILFLTAIFLGSIHLAWHYAVDGYLAAVLAVAVWKATARLAQTALADR